MVPGMTEQTRTMRYEGLYPSQVEERFQADAVEAARNGWFPTGQSWVGQELVVTYAYGQRWGAPSQTGNAGGPPPAAQAGAIHPAAAVVLIGGLDGRRGVVLAVGERIQRICVRVEHGHGRR